MKKLCYLSSVSIATSLTLMACGAQERHRTIADHHQRDIAIEDQKPRALPLADVAASDLEALTAEFNALPKTVILRVQLDEQGNEIPGSAEMVTTDAEVEDDSVEEAFAAGTVVKEELNTDDLDGDSSTQSFYGFNNVNYNQFYQSPVLNQINQFGGQGINTFNAGMMNMQQPWGASPYFNHYTPLAHSQISVGSHWQYSRPHCFNRPRARFFRYPRARCFGRCGF